MKVIGYLVLFIILGLAIGYLIYGTVNNKYVNPIQLFVKREGPLGWGIKTIYGLEKKRNNILISGAIGGIVGLFFGAIVSLKSQASKN